MKRNLVFVDDNQTIISILESELADDFNVSTFTNPRKALEYIQDASNQVDILLTDFMMPEMNGLQLVEAVKKTRKEIRAIILTGYCKELNDEQKDTYDLIIDKSVIVDNKTLIDLINQN